MVIKYKLVKKDKNSKARLGVITTPHNSFDTNPKAYDRKTE